MRGGAGGFAGSRRVGRPRRRARVDRRRAPPWRGGDRHRRRRRGRQDPSGARGRSACNPRWLAGRAGARDVVGARDSLGRLRGLVASIRAGKLRSRGQPCCVAGARPCDGPDPFGCRRRTFARCVVGACHRVAGARRTDHVCRDGADRRTPARRGAGLVEGRGGRAGRAADVEPRRNRCPRVGAARWTGRTHHRSPLVHPVQRQRHVPAGTDRRAPARRRARRGPRCLAVDGCSGGVGATGGDRQRAHRPASAGRAPGLGIRGVR